jgi:uncharacterized protein YoaH (UPF0181 family)
MARQSVQRLTTKHAVRTIANRQITSLLGTGLAAGFAKVFVSQLLKQTDKVDTNKKKKYTRN